MKSEAFANRTVHSMFNVSPGRDDSSVRLYGIEIELEGCRDTSGLAPRGWDITQDGSLRDGGVEFVSHGAQPLSQLAVGVANVYELSRRLGLVRTIRTSIHVHANVSNLTLRQLDSVLTLYCLLEPSLLQMCGVEREHNIFCVPWYRSDSEVMIWQRLRQGTVRSGVLSVTRQFCKYSALNLLPLTKFGTIEFRMAPVWRSVEGALRWLNVIDSIMEAGTRMDAATILERYDCYGLDHIVREVFEYDVLPAPDSLYVQEIAESLALRVSMVEPDFEDVPWPMPLATEDTLLVDGVDMHPFLDVTNLVTDDSDEEHYEEELF